MKYLKEIWWVDHCLEKELKRVVLVVFILFLSLSRGVAQKVELSFPALAGEAYRFVIFEGEKQTVLQEAVIPESGKVSLSFPQTYDGMCKWILIKKGSKESLDIPITPKHTISISSKDTVFNIDNLYYTGSNPIQQLVLWKHQQNEIVKKYEALEQLQQYYNNPEDQFYQLLIQEKQKQQQAFDILQQQIKKDDTYVSRFLPLFNILKAITPKLEVNQKVKAKAVERYIADSLNIQALYTSGIWRDVLSAWVKINIAFIKDDSVFVADFKKVANRIDNPEQYTAFVRTMSFFLLNYGKTQIITQLVPAIVVSNKITDYEGLLSMYKAGVVGDTAPSIQTSDTSKQFVELKGEHTYNKTLLVFYSTDCGHCEELLKQLYEIYPRLLQNKCRVIAIAGDEDKSMFEENVKNHPWQETYCDFKGVESFNFINYGVISTPTLFLIDNMGKIVSRATNAKGLLSKIEDMK